MKKYIVFDLDGTLINSKKKNEEKVISIIKDIQPEKVNQAQYILSTTAWMPLIKQLELIFKDTLQDINLEELTKKIYDEIFSLEKEVSFFPWVIEKIKELNWKYKLFVTTGNSTRFAKKELENVGIHKYFELILWSDEFLKWPEHIDIFKQKVDDENFCEHAIYIWDGERDREIAIAHSIPFVHIGEQNIDKYEIACISCIDDILVEFEEKEE